MEVEENTVSQKSLLVEKIKQEGVEVKPEVKPEIKLLSDETAKLEIKQESFVDDTKFQEAMRTFGEWFDQIKNDQRTELLFPNDHWDISRFQTSKNDTIKLFVSLFFSPSHSMSSSNKRKICDIAEDYRWCCSSPPKKMKVEYVPETPTKDVLPSEIEKEIKKILSDSFMELKQTHTIFDIDSVLNTIKKMEPNEMENLFQRYSNIMDILKRKFNQICTNVEFKLKKREIHDFIESQNLLEHKIHRFFDYKNFKRAPVMKRRGILKQHVNLFQDINKFLNGSCDIKNKELLKLAAVYRIVYRYYENEFLGINAGSWLQELEGVGIYFPSIFIY